MGVLCCVRMWMNNFSSQTTRARDIVLLLKDTLSIEDDKLLKECRSVCLQEPVEEKYSGLVGRLKGWF